MSNKTMLVLFVLSASTLFPIIGYYLDYRTAKRKRKIVENSEPEKN
jgi:hypothetical protein